MPLKHLQFDASRRVPLLGNAVSKPPESGTLSSSKVHHRPEGSSQSEDASVYFVGTATTIIDWQGFRILTDPNFLHAGDHVHLGPGVEATRQTNPAVELEQLPAIDCILLSHYHEDHFDKHVENVLNRQFPIVTTHHAHGCLTSSGIKDQPFQQVTALDVFESSLIHIDPPSSKAKQRVVKVTGMPGKHVAPGALSAVNDLLGAVPPTNGWLLELGYSSAEHGEEDLYVGYTIYISGDTLFVDELRDIPKQLNGRKLDLMLAHLGGTTIPGPSVPLFMVTMDAKHGVQLIQLMRPDVTIPIHYDDYDVFMSPLSDFQREVERAGLQQGVVYLDRGESYKFAVNK